MGGRGAGAAVTLILDSGGVTALAGQRARMAELRRRGAWPPEIPSVVLTESLTGDPRRDFHVNGLVRLCRVVDVDEPLSREAAALRTRTGRASTISAVDAVVAATADRRPGSTVLTSNPADLRALLDHASHVVTVIAT